MKTALLFSFLGLLFACCAAAQDIEDLGDDCNTDHDSEIYECTGRTRCFACKDGQNVCCFPPTWMVPAGHQNFCCSNMKRRNCEVVDNLETGSLAANNQSSSAVAAQDNLMTYRCPAFTFCIKCPDSAKTTCAFPPGPFVDPMTAIKNACLNNKQLDCMSAISIEEFMKLSSGPSANQIAGRRTAGTRAMATLRKLKPDSSDLVVHLTIVKKEGNDLATVRLSGVRPGGYEYSIEFGPHTACGATNENSKPLLKSLVPGEQDVQVELTVTSLGELKGQPVTLLEYGRNGEKIAPTPYACGRFIVV